MADREHRLFVPQDTLDLWMSEEHVDVDGEVLTLRQGGQRFQLKTAVCFLEEVTEGGDEAKLLGKVKDLEQLGELGGEHVSDSVILGEAAYQVAEGFVGEPIFEDGPAAPVAETGDPHIDQITKFFLGRR